MMRLEHVVQIDAEPEVVWRVTEDVENWPRWSPTVESVARLDSGSFEVGSVARIKQPGLPAADWVVTELTRGVCFAWETRVRGVRMKALHELAATDPGTRSILRLEVSGAAGLILWPMIRRLARRALEQENTGLKTTCEDSSS